MATNVTVTVDAVDYVFSPDSIQQDAVKYQMTGSTLALPATLTARRVYPKRSKTYPGNARNILKLSLSKEYADDSVQPIIFELSVSRRADTSPTDFSLARDVFGQLVVDAELDNYFSNLAF
jgi:hypothetical protein